MSKAKLNPEVLDQNMPADVEAEMAVIGSMLQKQDACDDVAAIVCAADFDDDRNGVLFSAIMELRNGASTRSCSLSRSRKQNRLSVLAAPCISPNAIRPCRPRYTRRITPKSFVTEPSCATSSRPAPT